MTWRGDDRYLFLFKPVARATVRSWEAEVRFYLQDVVVGLNLTSRLPRNSLRTGICPVRRRRHEVPYQRLRRSEDTISPIRTTTIRNRRTQSDSRSLLMHREFRRWVSRVDDTEAVAFPKFESQVKTGRTWMENAIVRVDVHPHVTSPSPTGPPGS